MQAKPKDTEQPVRTSFFYGWIIVGICALGTFFSGPGQTYSVSMFINHYIHDLHLDRAVVSTIYSVATVCAGLLLYFMGRFIDRFGQRAMAVVIGTLLGLTCLFSSFVTGPIMLFISFLFLRLFGQGSMTLLPKTTVPQWFVLHRGRALSFMALGGFLSSALFPPLNAWMIGQWGWPVAWRVWGGLLIIVFVPLAGFFIRNRPEDVGLQPDNASPQKLAQAKKEKKDGRPIEEVSWTLKEAMRTRAFWMMLYCVALPAMINTAITFHMISIFGEDHLNTATGAIILSLMAIVGFPVTMVAGFIMERIPVNKVLAISFCGQIIFLFLLHQVSGFALAIVFGLVWGFIGGIERISLNIVWPNYFGRKHLGSINGIAMMTMVISSAAGPFIFGIGYDIFHSFKEVILLVMIFPVLGIIAALISPPPVKR